MRQQSFRHRGGTRSGFGGGILVIIVVLGGVFLVYQLILWFRSSNEKALADETVAVTTAGVATVSAASSAPLNTTAILRTTEGASVGTVVRSGSIEIPSYSMVASLSPIAPDASYEVWLVKDGLADVKSVGTLNLRADGSWATTFSTRDPLDYPTIVITLEPNDGNAEPSGNRVAEGRFE